MKAQEIAFPMGRSVFNGTKGRMQMGEKSLLCLYVALINKPQD